VDRFIVTLGGGDHATHLDRHPNRPGAAARSLIAVPATAAAAAAPDTARRQVIDLGTLGGVYTLSKARAVNDRGQVVGDSIPAGLGPEHAFLWEQGRMRDLGTLGGLISDATDINNHGQVVGASATTAGAVHAFSWAGGRMRDLGTLGGSTSVAQAINDHGRVVGTSTTASGETHAFSWAGGQMRDLGLASANDLNDRGQITGGAQFGDTFHAYRLQGGHLVDLDGADVPYSEGVAINEAGQVAGNSAPAPAEFNHAFLWSQGRRVDLGTLGGEFSAASGINDHGAVVGQASTTGGPLRGFVWRHGAMTDLGALATDGENGSRANDINNHGWIVGASDVPGGDFHAVLWR
jgi:probable HAF family extracellular repeat protein